MARVLLGREARYSVCGEGGLIGALTVHQVLFTAARVVHMHTAACFS